ncbi:NCS2 family permease [Fusobacterium perfoetens]|uniref:NCS2 family permease n=1 Tax=Fusobacterium perfoetens TaxID=852 RepID=UPI001F2B7339|nr:NCS2 family permease [Fusobacterium perfoetens]MCF2625430.1 NCS2 family permease [Fusobacterium perfoetens]
MSQNNSGIVKFLDEKFLISERGGSIRSEFFGGLTTFLTISYIIFVNPAVLSLTGMDKGALVTVTCVATAIGSFLGGILGNVPISLAPGVGLNAFFTFTLVMGNGISWQDALGVVFFSGVFYLVLAICGIREKIINSIPQQLSTAATVGIGLFLSLIGLKSMGIIEANPETLVKIAPVTLPVALSFAGLFLMYILDMKKVKGGVLISIIVISIVGMILGEVPMPEKLLSTPPSMSPLLFKLNVFGVMKVSLLGAIFSFMFIDLFDSLSVLMFTYKEVQFRNEEERKKGLGRMLLADCSSTIIGALLGTSTVTTYGESIAGIKVGAKTGLASIFTGLFFLLALFIAPIVEAIPVFAVAPALVIVGIFMFRNVAHLDLSSMKESIPAFMTIIFMPMTHSIAIGLSFGFISYIIINVACMDFKKISLTMWVIGALSVINLLI